VAADRKRPPQSSHSIVVAGLDLAELVDRKVAHELPEMNGRLEQLVADAVDRELERLVAEQLNTMVTDGRQLPSKTTAATTM
jgi:hypothetical protein